MVLSYGFANLSISGITKRAEFSYLFSPSIVICMLVGIHDENPPYIHIYIVGNTFGSCTRKCPPGRKCKYRNIRYLLKEMSVRDKKERE